jgi:hypothetical protein
MISIGIAEYTYGSQLALFVNPVINALVTRLSILLFSSDCIFWLFVMKFVFRWLLCSFVAFIFICWALRQNLENEYVTLVTIFYFIFVIESYSVTTV